MGDRVLALGRGVLRWANRLNWIAIVAFGLAVIASFPLSGLLGAQLARKYPAQDIAAVIVAMRVLLLLGMLAGVAAHMIFSRMLAIVASVDAGDPFVPANAERLQTIGWAVLAIQLLDLGYGALSGWFALHHIDQIGWSPSVGGWISVVMIFVLARVFGVGARMREDLEMTV